MEEFFPSEIARLVLGYLEGTNCEKSWKVFMKENPSLSEYFLLYQKGRVYSTNVNGKSLLDILREYSFLKREAMVKNEKELSKTEKKLLELESSIKISKESMEKCVKERVDHILHQYFPSLCISEGRIDTCDDDVTNLTDETEKDIVVDGNVKDLHDEIINTNSNTEVDTTLNASEENACCTSPQINITEVSSLKEVTCSNSKDNTYISSNKKSSNLLDVIKIEDEDVLIVDTISGSQNKSTDQPNNELHCQDSGSIDSYNAVEELDSENKSSISRRSSSVPDFSQSNIKRTTNSYCKPVNEINLGHLINTCLLNDSNDESHSDHNVECNKVANNKHLHSENIIATSSASLCGSNNLEIKQNATPNVQSLGQEDNAINTSNSPNSQSSFIITTNPTQCATAPLSTYILPNYSSNGCFVQNNAPYHIVINTPNGIPLAMSGVPISNIPSSTFTATDSNAANGMPFTLLNSGSIVRSMKVVRKESQDSTTVVVNEKESVKRKNEEELSKSKRTNSSKESVKADIHSANKKKEQPKKTVNKKSVTKEKSKGSPKPKQKRASKKKIASIFQSPSKVSARSPAKQNLFTDKCATVVLKQLSFKSDDKILLFKEQQ